MRILLTHRYFWPDSPPYAAMLRSIGDNLAAAGHEVHVFASKPSYRGGGGAPARERLGRLRVLRVPVFAESRRNPLGRVLNVAIYCGALFAAVLRVRPDVVIAATFPPVAAGWTASLAARLTGARFVYHMQDVHPEVSRHAGGRLGRGLPFRLLRALDSATLRRAAAIIVLSEDMAATLRARPGSGEGSTPPETTQRGAEAGARTGGRVGRVPGLMRRRNGDAARSRPIDRRPRKLPIHVVNNFELDMFGEAAPPPAGLEKPPGQTRVIFAGNLGRFQNLPLLAEGVARCFPAHPELELFLLGDGEALPALKARWQGNGQVRFAPFLPYARARGLIAGADIGLVSLARGIHRVSYPSKVLTYLALGLPMLALVEPDSALARKVRGEGLGVVPDDGTPEAIGAALGDLLAPGRLGAAHAAVRRHHAGRTARPAVLGRWRALMDALEAPAPRPVRAPPVRSR